MPRVGPPTPRNEPWRMPTPSLPEQPGRSPVPARDAAYARLAIVVPGVHDDVLRRLFNAGWDAREVNQEPLKLDTGSLFPTVGVDDVIDAAFGGLYAIVGLVLCSIAIAGVLGWI